MIGAAQLDWEELKTFAVVADSGTVRRASRELGVHHSTVSRRIDHLERALESRLFDRSPDGFVLTSAGEELADAVRDCGVRLNRAERLISGREQRLSGAITVTMAEPLAVHAFGPRLTEFTDQYPDIELRIVATADFLDVNRREADIAIRMDNNPPETLVGKRLFAYYQTVYATPGYLQAHDLKAEPESARWLGWDASDERFPAWTKDTEFGDVPVWGCFPELPMQQAAARGGLGLAMLPCFVADRDPALVRASKRAPLKSRDVWLLTHADL
ncbi:MAG: LysR family transcriptional regulator, partial [Pseudomonadota bacterium]